MQMRLRPRRVPRQARSRALVQAILESTAHILAERGYAGTNTNLVAKRAGVSIGSVYQYFPNKEALITALHEHHTAEICHITKTTLAGADPKDLQAQLAAIVHAWFTLHQAMPELHRILESELLFLELPPEKNPSNQGISRHIRQLLENHKHEIVPSDLDLATWVILQTIKSLIHAAVLTPHQQYALPAIEQAITEMVSRYLLSSSPLETG